jgi:ppGpp synthetase/RelA/SpoT-type nucleotidyltranferase
MTELESHGRIAAADYRKVLGLYENLAATIGTVLNQSFATEGLKVQSVQVRAKSVDSFERKASEESSSDPEKPKYEKPLEQITDMAGVRVIAFLPRDVEKACEIVAKEFEVLERTDKSEELIDEGKFGYQSIHFLAKLSATRRSLAEYSRFDKLVFEVQVRTILQHAWAEMEHDIQYKSSYAIPSSIKKRFIALAGLLEIADREFQQLQDDDGALRVAARKSVKSGEYESVEITADSLKAYLDKRLGSDGRVSQLSYDLIARHLIQLGFTTLKQVDTCIKGLDDDKICRALWANRQGQVTRFEGMLIAGMGQVFVNRHPWSKFEYWSKAYPERIENLKKQGIRVRSYDPLQASDAK